jgi:phage shock protein PspC (stress-responsive transcriptional regulator)
MGGGGGELCLSRKEVKEIKIIGGGIYQYFDIVAWLVKFGYTLVEPLNVKNISSLILYILFLVTCFMDVMAAYW